MYTTLVAAVCGVLLTGGAITVFASKADLVTVASVKQKNDPMLVLTRGMAEIVNVDGPVSDIMVANPAIVDVSSLQANKLYVVGVNYGTTNVIAVDAEGNVISRLNVHVKIDDVAIQSTVRKVFPDEEINITSTGEQVLLTGRVSSADVAARIADVVGSYMGGTTGSSTTPNASIVNLLTIEGEQQVMLKVKVVEASRDVLRELGVDTDIPGFNKASVSGSAGVVGAALGLTANPLGIGQVFYDTGTALGRVSVAIQALEEDGLVNTLAEPNLTAISGEQAGFLAGGEIPVPTGRDQNNNIVVTYRPFGVALNFRPVVMSDDRISLQLQTEVSSISNQGDVNIGVTVPSFAVRRASTTVEMGSGGSLMIAGLLQSDVTKGMTDIPGIKNVPILGKLASSESFNRQETELVVIVTAYLVKPYGDKTQADTVPAQASSPLSAVFAKNIRRTYSKLSLDKDLFNNNERYGYLLD
ncbi:MAG TPA: type II and III secretion system protein family protein [Alphaproteobacteria bacterium]